MSHGVLSSLRRLINVPKPAFRQTPPQNTLSLQKRSPGTALVSVRTSGPLDHFRSLAHSSKTHPHPVKNTPISEEIAPSLQKNTFNFSARRAQGEAAAHRFS